MARLGLLTTFILTLLLCTSHTAAAQEQIIESPETADSTIRVSLITCYPGPEIFQLYGHTAIRIQYVDYDFAYNYGVFSFREPNFVFRFVKGDAHYMLAACPFPQFLLDYKARRSKVVEQVLNLSEEQASQMLTMLVHNARPENREYRYDYIYDNCSTRPRDIIESTIGTSLSYTPPTDSTLSFRDIMHSYQGNYPWQSFGIDLALGYDLDRPLCFREYLFAPIYLEKALSEATYVDAAGNRVPVVSATNIILDGDDKGNILEATPWYLTPIVFALLIMLLSLAVTAHDLKRNKINRTFDTVLYTLYALAGCVIFFLIFISNHSATSPNLVGLWLNPSYFIPAVLIHINKCRKFLYLYLFINFALLLVLTIGGWCLPQYWDIAFYPLIIALIARQLNYIIQYRKNEGNI